MMRPTLAVLCPLIILAACATTGTKNDPAIPYRASGAEPFWSVQVDGGRLLLDRTGEAQLTRALAPPIATMNGRRYAGQGVVLNILSQRCENAMSGASFTETVTMEIDGHTLKGCGGAELPPEKLEGTQWIVTELDGQAVSLDPPPSLAIDADGRVTGSDGCNRFMGGLVLDGLGSVKATTMPGGASTMMACPEPRDGVSRTYNTLRAAATQWRFDGAMLLLASADGKTIRLRRTY